MFLCGWDVMDVLRVNGSERRYDPGEMPGTLSDLLQELSVEAATVVAEVDGVIIRREEFGRTPLTGGQSIELVKFMGGG